MSDDKTIAGRGRVVNLGLGVEVSLLARLDRLRACLGISRATVAEMAMVHSLNKLERKHADKIERFDALAQRAGMSWLDYAAWYANEYKNKTYPPGVERLEAMEQGKGGVLSAE